jgi:hypothetical protein
MAMASPDERTLRQRYLAERRPVPNGSGVTAVYHPGQLERRRARLGERARGKRAYFMTAVMKAAD